MFSLKLSRLHPALQLLDARSRGLCGLLALVASLLTLSGTLALSGTTAQERAPTGLRALACKPADPGQAQAPCRCAQPLTAAPSCARSS